LLEHRQLLLRHVELTLWVLHTFLDTVLHLPNPLFLELDVPVQLIQICLILLYFSIQFLVLMFWINKLLGQVLELQLRSTLYL
jgi:hypothetical protein